MSDPTPQPDPTQAEADDLAAQAHGGVADESEPATAPPVNADVPAVTRNGAVTASAAVGDTLNCTMGNWQNEPTSYAYAWKSDGATDLGAGQDYVVAATDAGHSITCVVTAINALGSTAAPPSNAVSIT
jgi:hypothetical protein